MAERICLNSRHYFSVTTLDGEGLHAPRGGGPLTPLAERDEIMQPDQLRGGRCHHLDIECAAVVEHEAAAQRVDTCCRVADSVVVAAPQCAETCVELSWDDANRADPYVG